MKEERSINLPQMLPTEDYPYNLLLVAKGLSSLELPETITDDIMAGIQYAITTLDDREAGILRQRFIEKKTRPEIGAFFGVSQARIRQIETKAARKLRIPSRWKYIKYGFAAAVRIDLDKA